MKVVHLIDSGGFYGAEVMLLNLCIAQIQLNIDVEVISIGKPGEGKKAIEEKLLEAGIPMKPWRMLPLPNLWEAFKIVRYCAQKNARIIHSHGYKGNILLGLLPRFLRPIPVITTLHGYTRQKGRGKMMLNQWLDKHCIKHLDAIVLVSPDMKHQIPYKKLEKKIAVVPNGIPLLENTKTAPIYSSLFTERNYKIGALGRLSHEKNFSLLIDAMPLVREAIPEAKLVIYGEGSERTALASRITASGLDHCISLPGYLDNTQDFFADLDVFVNCSLTEGMPISLLEAMRQGTPIVATDIPANRHLLELSNASDYLSGLTAQELANKIIYLYKQSDSHIKQLSFDYISGFQTRFTAAIMARKYLDIYEAKHAR